MMLYGFLHFCWLLDSQDLLTDERNKRLGKTVRKLDKTLCVKLPDFFKSPQARNKMGLDATTALASGIEKLLNLPINAIKCSSRFTDILPIDGDMAVNIYNNMLNTPNRYYSAFNFPGLLADEFLDKQYGNNDHKAYFLSILLYLTAMGDRLFQTYVSSTVETQLYVESRDIIKLLNSQTRLIVKEPSTKIVIYDITYQDCTDVFRNAYFEFVEKYPDFKIVDHAHFIAEINNCLKFLRLQK